MPTRYTTARCLLALMLTFSVIVSLSVAVPAEACPSCKTAMDSSEKAPDTARPYADEAMTYRLGEGFYWSILLMLSLPAMIATGFGLAWWHSARRPLDAGATTTIESFDDPVVTRRCGATPPSRT